ncbi:hypothetical protein PVAP13_5NG332281 [Panicum virgatum]|uniref:Uncharacterized protein n=1 Tax=Panicum virgatum TaxID=38727 RepID=A0A8T0RVU2_PANVG|nr:hypothetical protein PVAP13_5NG332281 [Panicum virgatum]
MRRQCEVMQHKIGAFFKRQEIASDLKGLLPQGQSMLLLALQSGIF